MEERLKKFAAVVDYGGFTAAARELNTSQPGLTSAVQKLERELKTPLLVRPARRLLLTPAGRIAYEQGRQLQVLAANMGQALAELQAQKQSFRLGCIDSVADQLVHRKLLERLESQTALSLNVQSSGTLLLELKRGRLDIAIAVQQTTEALEFASQRLGGEPFALVCTPARLAAVRAGIRQGRLADFLAYNQESTTFLLLQKRFENLGLVPEPRFYSTNPSVLLQLAEQGKGTAALPRTMIATRPANRLTEITLQRPLSRPLTAYWLRGRTLPPIVRELLQTLRKPT